ncbi:hypothetical protein Tmath_1688 [Thermoanaerobacter mathranii subsp. mathranii str. A3]|uniref:Uncharacterized protein n=1 Tax=Thermoanaerobacter mathranii subsp. mathranii (strain DSM 11426 / CCUG 53645 / CIP 108742 / A3) TaxID=583358 RepID=A0ABN3Z3A4_THEM3|nr:hypothetical protein Tmath_1688 [Thermoanaerobacter mathranii subsp. mathranii str. A3]
MFNQEGRNIGLNGKGTSFCILIKYIKPKIVLYLFV